MPTITLESSDRSKRKSRMRSNLRSYGTRHGESFWEEEKSRNNFGLKYMNKFGWNKGDGLGKNKQGDINHVKARLKNDNRGIGCKNTQSDHMFQATMCMFNDILSGLNNKKKDKNASDSSTKRTSTEHLTASAVIKSYEAKHHLYGKFRAAKDISNRSEQDKAELFGNVASKGFTENDQANYAMQMSQISSGYSGKMGLGFGQNDDRTMNRNTLMFGKFTRSGTITRTDIIEEAKEDANDDNDVKSKKKKKDKKKKSKKKKVSQEDKNEKKKKKKKKKKKDKTIEDNINIVIHESVNMDTINTEVNGEKSVKKKKKKKNKKRKLKENDLEIEPPLKKMKVDTEIISDNMSDVSSTASILSAIQTPVQSDVEINEEKKEKKKKKKKNKKSKSEKKEKSKKKKKKDKKTKKKKKDGIM